MVTNDLTIAHLHGNMGWGSKKIAKSLGISVAAVEKSISISRLLDGFTSSKREKFLKVYNGNLERAATSAGLTLPQAASVILDSNLNVDKQVLAVSLYKEGWSLQDCASALQTTLHEIRKLLPDGVVRNSKYTAAGVNGRFFDIIDTEEKAYWLGFVAADGWITSNGKRIGIKLHIRDGAHVEKFARALQYQGNTYTYDLNTNYGFATFKILNITSVELNAGLINAGCTFDKSRAGVVPNISSPYLDRHYIRGLIDGDGFYSKNSLRASLSGALPTVSWVRDHSEIKSTSPRQVSNYTWTINWHGRCANELILWLYGDAHVFLDRKYNLIKENYEVGASI